MADHLGIVVEEKRNGKSNMNARLRYITLAFAASVHLSPVMAADLDAPSGRVILTVGGTIDVKNDGDTALFDLDAFERIGLTTVSTETPWTDGTIDFQGVLVRDLIATLGASGTHLRATALDDYAITIALEEFDAFDVILATRRDGEIMKVRNKGPVWLIYPWSDFRELQNEANYSKGIWQVTEIEFE